VTDRKAVDKYYCSLASQMKALDLEAVRNYREPNTKDIERLPELIHQHRWHQ
jgi:hypothetical protein